MQRLKIDQDIKPLSEVRIGIAGYIKQVRDTKRPVVITQHGKGVGYYWMLLNMKTCRRGLNFLQMFRHLLANSQAVMALPM